MKKIVIVLLASTVFTFAIMHFRGSSDESQKEKHVQASLVRHALNGKAIRYSEAFWLRPGMVDVDRVKIDILVAEGFLTELEGQEALRLAVPSATLRWPSN